MELKIILTLFAIVVVVSTGPAPPAVTCSLDGEEYIRNPTDCAKFFKCSHGVPYSFDCPADLHFNTDVNYCDWPQNVDCSNDDAVSAPPAVTCSLDGDEYIRNPIDCAKFFKCSHGVPNSFDCPAGLHFNANVNYCDWPQNVDCSNDDADTLTEITCEDDTLQLSCDLDKRETIQIISVNYGRKDFCPCIDDWIGKSDNFNFNCGATSSMSVVSSSCDGRGQCSVDAVNAVFGDPCVGTYKYLEVQYRCISSSSSYN